MSPNVLDARKGINLRQLDAVLQIWYILRTSLRGGAVAARRAHNPKVAGSNPAPATKKETARHLVGRFAFWR